MEVFHALAILAIISGGVISAFSARHPSRFAMWVTAYLVLVVGVIQAGFVISWQSLTLLASWPAIIAFSLFNIGNGAVIYGRWLKGKKKTAHYVVYLGGALIALSMIILGILSLGAPLTWAHSGFLALIIVILVSMPIGLFLSARPHKH